jgi:cyclopropane fatty-acyl-phospholipid synthase-like methyltransferase
LEKRQGNKRQQSYFGTYHHSTPRDSEKIREKVKVLFTEAFRELPFSNDDELKILDIGCGLGFLSCLCAEYYSNAMVRGFDSFEDASLKNSSLAKAKNNAKVLGFSDRITFQKRDFFQADYSNDNFDLFVSNLVFHNFGRRRLDAYERLARWSTSKSYAVLSELFFDYKSRYKRLTSLFESIQERPCSTLGKRYKILVLSKPRK